MDLPDWDRNGTMWEKRRSAAAGFARQIIATCSPFHKLPPNSWRVLDVGSGWGYTAAELARECSFVVGAEPAAAYLSHAQGKLATNNLKFIQRSGLEISKSDGPFDIVVLDNVYEHMPNQRNVLTHLAGLLAPGGLIYVLVPNKIWPIEVHYGLPFLSWLPLSLANRYLRMTRRGSDYTDASYAPTYFSLKADFRSIPNLECKFVLPADISLTQDGGSILYKMGIAAIRKFPSLWVISKAFLVLGISK